MMTDQTFTVSNPRKELRVEDWPIGGSNKGLCLFSHESNNRGERIGRQTVNKHGVMCKVKYSTYYRRACIVDGSDGRTHILGLTTYGISVMSGDMKHSDFSVFPRDENFDEYLKMLTDEDSVVSV